MTLQGLGDYIRDLRLAKWGFRSTAIELKGSGLGSVPINRIVRAIEELFNAAVAGRFEMATKLVPLSQVEQAWSINAYMPRVVITNGEQRG
jgi:hypothetical protein